MTPVTPEQWQDAVDAAHHLLELEKARLYELVREDVAGALKADIPRCVEIIEQGAARGIFPRAVAIPRTLLFIYMLLAHRTTPLP